MQVLYVLYVLDVLLDVWVVVVNVEGLLLLAGNMSVQMCYVWYVYTVYTYVPCCCVALSFL